MAYKAKTVIEETGANNLYLALGSLLWQLDDRELRSPLVLVPVRLTTRARQQSYRIEIDESGASTPNFCLLEKLRLVHGLHVPGLAQPAEDGAGIDLDARAAGDAGGAGRGRPAVPGGGQRGTRGAAVRQVPARGRTWPTTGRI